MQEIICDCAIIGSGPAGQSAAMQAAKLHKRVVVIEKDEEVGGASLHSGTIPSKALRAAIMDLTNFSEQSFYGRRFDPKHISINDLSWRLHKVLREEKALVVEQMRRACIDIIYGFATFEGPKHLLVKDFSGTLTHRIKASVIIIAAGSSPRDPENVPFDGKVVLDSTALLKIDHVPKSMIVVGSGVIGSEYASFFSLLGTEVLVLDKEDRMLNHIDSEIGGILQTRLQDFGLHFMGGKFIQGIEHLGTRARVRCKDGLSLEADTVLYALGRVANVSALGIDKAGITLTERGHIPVNDLFQTVVPHIYAVGDVIGAPALASTSAEQGRLAARQAFGAFHNRFPKVFPLGIYAIPEISSIGPSEDELKAKGHKYEVGRAYYHEIAKGNITGSTTGLFKIIFNPETLEILGVHIIGRNATEVIHIGQVAMSYHAHLDYFIEHVFNYPTFAEGYRLAAFNGIDKVKSRY